MDIVIPLNNTSNYISWKMVAYRCGIKMTFVSIGNLNLFKKSAITFLYFYFILDSLFKSHTKGSEIETNARILFWTLHTASCIFDNDDVSRVGSPLS
jgi:hypothetical protein